MSYFTKLLSQVKRMYLCYRKLLKEMCVISSQSMQQHFYWILFFLAE